MKTIDKRIAALEELTSTRLPYVVFQYGNNPPAIPDHVGDRPVMIVNIVAVEPPVRDNDGNIIEPARAWNDDDPRYLKMARK